MTRDELRLLSQAAMAQVPEGIVKLLVLCTPDGKVNYVAANVETDDAVEIMRQVADAMEGAEPSSMRKQ
jgi:hypothetical protein